MKFFSKLGSVGLALTLLALITTTPPALAARKKATPAPQSPEYKENPTPGNAFHRGLHKTKLKSSQVVHGSQLSEDPPERRFNRGKTLAYVTPWNRDGYTNALVHAGVKLDLVSPCWWRVSPPGKSYAMLGAHDVNATWASEVRSRGARVVPRVAFEGWAGSDWEGLVRDHSQIDSLVAAVLAGVGPESADGIVLDVGILPINNLLPMVGRLVRGLRAGLGDGRVLALTVPPSRNPARPAPFGETELLALSDSVDHFSLMTYDYSHPGAPGPNAPLGWVRECLNRIVPPGGKAARQRLAGKVLMGLNFYGNDYVLPSGGGPIVGAQYIDVLRERRPDISWEQGIAEHTFSYTKGAESHRVFYPTLASIRARIDLARHYGVGLSIWEIGQGLPYFFDTL